MDTLVAVLIVSAPVAGMAGLLTLVKRGQQRRQAEIARQIALTDALHARLGGAVAPVVRWRRRRWQVAVAVPFERTALVAEVLVTVKEMFGRVACEVVLSRQAGSAPRPPRARHAAALGLESLSWT